LQNFLDDFSGLGTGGITRKDFGVTIFHPISSATVTSSRMSGSRHPRLNVTLGLRYENFGQVANALPYPHLLASIRTIS
jgi:hypothetical protein